MAVSIASRMAGSIDVSRGVTRISSSVTPSNRAICSRTNASPPARTPAIISSATRTAFSFDAPRRVSRARSAASYSPGNIHGLLHPRDQLAHLLRFRAIEVLADDQAWRDLGDHILQLQLVYAHG